MLGILPGHMLDVVLRPMLDMLLVHAHTTVAMHAANSSLHTARELRHRNFNPAPHFDSVGDEQLLLFAHSHLIIRHPSSSCANP